MSRYLWLSPAVALFALAGCDKTGDVAEFKIVNPLTSKAGTPVAPKPTVSSPEEMVGKPLPKFEATDLAGLKFTNENIKGKVALFDFWATWCGPCLKASPKMQELHEKYGTKGAMIVGANCSERDGGAKAKQYPKEHDYNYTFTFGNDKLNRAFNAQGIPLFVLADKEGVVRKTWVGFSPGLESEMATEIEGLLAK